ncbi:MAG: ATP-binding cassette domain-containing protein, partial [Romboutsia sp.]|nr:ATP-binding cassette domain-containing protein [Romboutsia sp.]
MINYLKNNDWLTSENNISEGISNFFKHESEFSILIEPLLKQLNWQGNYKQLIQALPHYADSLDLTEFINFLERLNFNSNIVNISSKDIDERLFPCLYLSDTQPAILILNKTKNGTYHTYNSEDKCVKECSSLNLSGKAIFCNQFINSSSKKETNLFSLITRRFKNIIVQIFTITVLLNMFAIFIPFYIMFTYDKIIPADSTALFENFAIGAAIVLLGIQTLSTIRAKLMTYIGARVDKIMGEQLVNTLFYLSPSFTENETVGNQLSRLKNFDIIKNYFSSNLTINIIESPFILFYLLCIYVLADWIVIIPIIFIFLNLSIYIITATPITAMTKEVQETNHNVNSFRLDSLHYLKNIKLSGKENCWIDIYKEKLINNIMAQYKLNFTNLSINTCVHGLMLISGILVISMGAFYVMERNLSLGGLIAVMMLTWKTLANCRNLVISLPKVSQLITNIKQLDLLLKLPTEQTDQTLQSSPYIEPCKVTFERVSFRYNSEQPPALLGVSFDIEPGDFVCIVGKNGAGKSTLLKLILNLYKPQTGSILINNVNINQQDNIYLRQNIGYMPQENKIFFGTIEQNLRFSKPEATNDELELAIKMAGLHQDIIQLPEGIKTKIGDKSKLSLSSNFL